ncbi:MAG: TraM recognition domain-containing protein [Eggerthellaceae bacterium]|nr:TraM recognition domain-containing protein [Eggerthellaceae bacterium]
MNNKMNGEWTRELGNLSLGITVGMRADGQGSVFQFNEDRFRHMLVIGRTGSGKSNHILQMEREDILSGAGVAIIAAHEEDAIYPLTFVPEERMDDVVLIDASNKRYLPCMNPLDVDRNDKVAVDKAIDDVVELLKTGEYYQWSGPRMYDFVRNGLKLILHPKFPDDPSLLLLSKLYADPDYVRNCLMSVDDERLNRQWRIETSAHRSGDHDDSVQWFLSKIDRIAENETLRHVFGPGKSTIDIQQIVNEGKILVAAIPEARVGRDVAQLLSSWLVARLHDAILNRGCSACETRVGKGDRFESSDLGIFGETANDLDTLEPFFVYIDEFAKFVSPNFEGLFAEARKYRVGFVLSLQTLSQVRILDRASGLESNLAQAILGNVGSIICYQVGLADSSYIAEQFGIDAEKVRRIERYRPLARLCLDNQPFQPLTLIIGPKPEPDRPNVPKRIARRHIGRRIWLPTEYERSLRGVVKCAA